MLRSRKGALQMRSEEWALENGFRGWLQSLEVSREFESLEQVLEEWLLAGGIEDCLADQSVFVRSVALLLHIRITHPGSFVYLCDNGTEKELPWLSGAELLDVLLPDFFKVAQHKARLRSENAR